jgi:hypothetical protein
VTRWYDEGYSPIVEFIKASTILSQFQGNTETDLYLWIMEHRDQFASDQEMAVEMKKLIELLAADHGHDRLRKMIRNWFSNPFGKTD